MFFVFCFFFILESGPGAYESGIMVSKAVEIYIQGKLLKPAGEHVFVHIHTIKIKCDPFLVLSPGSADQESHQEASTKIKSKTCKFKK